MVTSTWGTSGPVKGWPLGADQDDDTPAGRSLRRSCWPSSGQPTAAARRSPGRLTQTRHGRLLPFRTCLLDPLILRGPRAPGPSPSPGAAASCSIGYQSRIPPGAGCLGAGQAPLSTPDQTRRPSRLVARVFAQDVPVPCVFLNQRCHRTELCPQVPGDRFTSLVPKPPCRTRDCPLRVR